MDDLLSRLRAVWGYHAGLAMDGGDAHRRMADTVDEAIAELDRLRAATRARSEVLLTLDRCDRCGWPTAADGCAPGRCIAPDLRRVREEVGR